MTIPDRELAGTIRFAMQATKDLNLSDFRSQKSSVERLGVELGHELARVLLSRKNNDTYEALASFWNQSELGHMEITPARPPLIRLTNCHECGSYRPGADAAPCAFKRSLMETVFRDSVSPRATIEELECCKRQGEACVFRVKQNRGSANDFIPKVQATSTPPAERPAVA